MVGFSIEFVRGILAFAMMVVFLIIATAFVFGKVRRWMAKENSQTES